MLFVQVISIGMLVIGMTIPVYILAIWTLFKKCNISGPLKIFLIFGLLVCVNAFVEIVIAIYRFMASSNMNDFTSMMISHSLLWFIMAAIDNVISIKKIGAVYSQSITGKLLNTAMIVVILFSSVEFLVYMTVLSNYGFNIQKMVISQEYLLFLKPWMLVHFVITFALNIAALSLLYTRAECKSLKGLFLVQYVNKFQIRIVDLLISLLFVSISIIFKSIQFATGFLPIDVFVDTFLLVWLLYIHLTQLSFQNGTSNPKSGPPSFMVQSAGTV